MRTIIILFVCLTNLCAVLPLSAQISFGGKPLFINHSEATDLRSEQAIPVVEMPVFDLDSALRLDKINEQNMRGSFTFAHKFYTKIRKETDGENGVLPDGTKYWRVAIHSSKAYSINLLFTKFRLPEGGKLFIYNTDFSHVIGAFDSRNNSDDGILPVRPVSGEEIIVEYSEPADAPFEAELEIGEVNHDYRDILRNEPANDNNATINFACMADAICEAADNPNTRAVVLLIINGTSGCTGTLINNAENDGTPYLLTAVHCLNSEIAHSVSKNKDFYIARAGTIIAFFNYQRPICGSSLRATEEMTLARTYPRTIMEKQDIALLEFQERPPFYYNAY
ncbi:MAG: lysyl endopeptidase, partial [Dysgonamonadaceae bacterium]|nr:lysyl endopeptidase [Dysgonamonadaceae bacterium]